MCDGGGLYCCFRLFISILLGDYKPVTPAQILYFADAVLKGNRMYDTSDPILDDLPVRVYLCLSFAL